jgi:N-carbamoyl-L-amino-acid hydrolase
MTGAAARFRAPFDALAAIGRNSETGGYNRFAWTAEDRAARDWFMAEAERAGAVMCETDRNGNVWAWFGEPSAPDVVVTGSHLDTVPEGGAYDGALGVVAGLLAAAALQTDGASHPPTRALAVVAFADEEGARFGVACTGSKLLTGALDPRDVLMRQDGDGVRLADAVHACGVAPAGMGADADRLGRLRAFVELHVEQGRRLDHLGVPVAAATEIWPHGRWRLRVTGEANHAGTTLLEDRRDPMLALAAAVTAAREHAARCGGVATVARAAVTPNGTNVIPGAVDAWLDARAPTVAALDDLRGGWSDDVLAAAAAARVDATVSQESFAPPVTFDAALRDAVGVSVAIPTGAGHDAGILAPFVPTAMLFVRNPTGISHSPAEHATDDDCVAGIDALTATLRRLVTT